MGLTRFKIKSVGRTPDLDVVMPPIDMINTTVFDDGCEEMPPPPMLHSTIVYVDKPVEVEKIVYVDRPIEVIKEQIVEIEKIIDRPIEVIKEVFIEVIKEIPVEVKSIEEKIVQKIPAWAVGMLASETVLLMIILVHKLLR